MSYAWLFPGHGAQYPGMGRALLHACESARTWLADAETVSGQPLARVIAVGPAAELRRPSVLEPALAALGGAYVDWLRDTGHEPAAVAGYSAGEVGALYAAGVLDRQACLKVALVRGRILDTVAAQQLGGMVSFQGIGGAELHEAVAAGRKAGRIGLAAYNGPRHATVAGESHALASASATALALGAEISPVDAAGPWHTDLLEPARRALREQLDDIPFAPPRVPVWMGAPGRSPTSAVELRQALADALANPIRWIDVISALLKRHRHFLEVGPGRTLVGLLGQFNLPQGISRRSVERPGAMRLQTVPPIPSIERNESR